MNKTKKFSPEVRERAVRLVQEHRGEYPSLWAAVESIAPKMGCVPQTLLEWVKRQEIDSGVREGVSTAEAIKGIDIAIDDGLPLLVFSFHSPSLAAGYTPYVRSEADLAHLYAWWKAIFAYLKQRNIRPASVADILAAVRAYTNLR